MNPATQNTPDINPTVATRKLTTRILRMTNKERKACQHARSNAAFSEGGVITGNKDDGYTREDGAPAYPDERKLMGKSFKQLANLAKRIPVHYQRLRRAKVKTSKELPRAILTARMDALRSFSPLVEKELLRRGHNHPIDL